MTSASLDFSSSRFLADPYTAYWQLREHEPVRWFEHSIGAPTAGMWLISRYEDVKIVLQDSRFRKDMRAYAPEQASGTIPNSMLFTDPPDHARLRSLVNLAFTPKLVRGLEPKIVEVVDHLLDSLAEVPEADLIDALALPLPVIVIAEMLGVPSDDRALFREWSNDVVNGGDAFLASEEKRQRSDAAQLALLEYFGELIAQRRSRPREDLISALLQAQADGERLTDDELLATCTLLLIAGHETTVNLIGNGVLLLLRHPEQLRRLRDQPVLLETAIEEMLRFESPVQRATFRFAGEDIVLQGQLIETGQQVSAVIGAANRDPRHFDEPERFDVSRNPNRHLAFGRGIHFCLGAPLARAEARLAISRLLARFERIEGDVEHPAWRMNSGFRGLRELRVSLGE